MPAPWLKCHYLVHRGAGTISQWGFYSPATIVKDAQRHGLKVKPIDVTVSDWACTLEPICCRSETDLGSVSFEQALHQGTTSESENVASGENVASAKIRVRARLPVVPKTASYLNCHPETTSVVEGPAFDAEEAWNFSKDAFRHDQEPALTRNFATAKLPNAENASLQNHLALRMGLRYARGLREEAAKAIIRERNRSPFTSIADLAYRVPELRRDEMVLLASIGALNAIGTIIKNELHTTGTPAAPKLNVAMLWEVECTAAAGHVDGIWRTTRHLRGER